MTDAPDFTHPRGAPFKDKPPYGTQPCNRCGQYCEDQLCILGVLVFDVFDGPCPALEYEGIEASCGLCTHPQRYVPVSARVRGVKKLSLAAMVLTGQTVGCDAQIEGEDGDPVARARIKKVAANTDSRVVEQALKVWGVHETTKRIGG